MRIKKRIQFILFWLVPLFFAVRRYLVFADVKSEVSRYKNIDVKLK